MNPKAFDGYRNHEAARRSLLVAALLALGISVLMAATSLSPSANAAGSGANFDGTIYAIAPDGSGGFYVGGTFTNVTVGGTTTAAKNLVHINKSGSYDSSWRPEPNGSVRAIKVVGSTVYFGGTFTQIYSPTAGANVTRNRIAAWGTDGTISAFNPNVSTAGGQVAAIDSDGTYIYFTGTFATVGGGTKNNAAAATLAGTGAASWNPNLNAAGTSIVVNGSGSTGDVYIGGTFTTIQGSGGSGVTRNRAAAISTTTGTGAGTVRTWNPNLNGAVNALKLNGSLVYIGGAFTTIQGAGGSAVTRNRAASISSTTSAAGTVGDWNPNMDGTVNSLDVDGSRVFLGGAFANQDTNARGKGAAVDTDGTAVNWNPNFLGGDVMVIEAVAGYGLATGGSFTSINLTSTTGTNNNTPQDFYAGPAQTSASLYQNTNDNPVSGLTVVDNKAQIKGQNWSFFDASGNNTSRYQWQRCTTYNDASSCSNITGKATGGTWDNGVPKNSTNGAWYGLTDNDISYQVRLNVYYNTVSGLIETFSALTPKVTPVRNVNPSIGTYGPGNSGPTVGSNIKPLFGNWNGYISTSTYQYQWERCGAEAPGDCEDIMNPNGTTYTGYWYKPTPNDVACPENGKNRFRWRLRITTRGMTTGWAYTPVTAEATGSTAGNTCPPA